MGIHKIPIPHPQILENTVETMTGYTCGAMEDLSCLIKGKKCLVSLVRDLVYWFIDAGIK